MNKRRRISATNSKEMESESRQQSLARKHIKPERGEEPGRWQWQSQSAEKEKEVLSFGV
jgi:hypothetical protein